MSFATFAGALRESTVHHCEQWCRPSTWANDGLPFVLCSGVAYLGYRAVRR